MKRKIFFIVIACAVLTLSGCKSSDYKKAAELMDSGSYDEAIVIFEELGDYNDSADKVTECKYGKATALCDDKQFDSAQAVFEELGDYKDSADKVTECKYGKATALYDDKQFDDAQAVFEELGDYKDSTDKVTECKYGSAVSLYDSGDFKTARAKFKLLGDYKDSEEYAENAMWEILYEHYPYAEEDGATVVKTETIENSTDKFNICATKEKDGLMIWLDTDFSINDSVVTANLKKSVTLIIYKGKDDASVSGISATFFPDEEQPLNKCLWADLKLSQYDRNYDLDWTYYRNFTGEDPSAEPLLSFTDNLEKITFNANFDIMMSYLKEEFDNNGLGFTLADIGFTNY